MYRYDEFDHSFVRERVAEFKDQVERRLTGELTEEEFRPLRLRGDPYCPYTCRQRYRHDTCFV